MAISAHRVTDGLDVKMEMCRMIREDDEVKQRLAMMKHNEKELKECIIPRRYNRETLDGITASVCVFEVPGGTTRANTSALMNNMEIDILVAEQNSTAADAAKRRIIAMFDGAHLAGRRVWLLADPGSLTAATGFYRVAVRFCFSTFIKN